MTIEQLKEKLEARIEELKEEIRKLRYAEGYDRDHLMDLVCRYAELCDLRDMINKG